MRVTVNVCKDALKSPWWKRRVPMGSLPEPVFEEPTQQELYREVMALLGVQQTAVTTRLVRGRELLKNGWRRCGRMSNRKFYQDTFSEVHSSSEIRWEDMETMRSRKNVPKTL